MKYSELDPIQAKANAQYISQRWSQLSTLELDWSNEAIKYLFLVNSGAAAAVLAFIGAVDGIRGLTWPVAMLSLFAVGIILVGVIHATRYHRIDWIYENWRKESRRYYDSQLCFDDLLEEDDDRAYSFNWSFIWAYGSLFCFVFGVLIGALNFGSITKGEKNGWDNQKAATSAAAAPTAQATSKVSTGSSSGLDQKRQAESRLSRTPAGANQKEIKQDSDKGTKP